MKIKLQSFSTTQITRTIQKLCIVLRKRQIHIIYQLLQLKQANTAVYYLNFIVQKLFYRNFH